MSKGRPTLLDAYKALTPEQRAEFDRLMELPPTTVAARDDPHPERSRVMPPRTLHATVRVADMPQFKELVKAAQAVIDAPDRVSHYDPLLDQHWEAVEHLARTLRDLGFVTAAKGAA